MKVLLRVAAATPGVAIILCGIPDICQRYHSQIDLRKITEFRQELDKFRDWDGEAVLLPFYPPAYLSPAAFDSVQDINDRIKQANRHRGEVTPDVIRKVFRPPSNRLNHTALHDGVHPRRWLCEEYTKELEHWSRARERRRRQQEKQREETKNIERQKRERDQVKELAAMEMENAELERKLSEQRRMIAEKKIKIKYDKKREDARRKLEQQLRSIDEEEKEELKQLNAENDTETLEIEISSQEENTILGMAGVEEITAGEEESAEV